MNGSDCSPVYMRCRRIWTDSYWNRWCATGRYELKAIETSDALQRQTDSYWNTWCAAEGHKLTAFETRDALQEDKLAAIETRDALQEDKLAAIETRDALQEDTNWQLLKHVFKVLIFD